MLLLIKDNLVRTKFLVSNAVVTQTNYCINVLSSLCRSSCGALHRWLRCLPDFPLEYAIAAQAFGLSQADLWNLVAKSIDYTFLPDSSKAQLKAHIETQRNAMLNSAVSAGWVLVYMYINQASDCCSVSWQLNRVRKSQLASKTVQWSCLHKTSCTAKF